MKKLIILLLAVCLAVSSCGKSKSSSKKSSRVHDSSSEVQTKQQDKSKFAQKTEAVRQQSLGYFSHSDGWKASPYYEQSDIEKLKKDINGLEDFPVFMGSQVQYFPSGEEFYASLLEELDKAQEFIFMEYFILEEGEMWSAIHEILSRKLREGVEIRLMIDGFDLSAGIIDRQFIKALEQEGISVRIFSPINVAVSENYSARDHRKLTVIDGKTAYTGGVNLADEYINAVEKYGKWKDNSILIRGGAVDSCTLMFLQLWNIYEEEPDWESYLRNEECPGEDLVMPFSEDPFDDEQTAEAIYLDLINTAEKSVKIMTPYLILDRDMENALKAAAQRGVEVTIIIPGIPDKETVYAAAKTFYPRLYEAGIKLYEYSPGFIHSKAIICDDSRGVVGTINLDYRSFYEHFECGFYLCGEVIGEVSADFENTIPVCRAVTQQVIDEIPFDTQLEGELMQLIKPML